MITSRQNDKVKQWIKLKSKKGRQKSQSFLIEGFHLIEEALKAEATIVEIIASELSKELLPEDWFDLPINFISEAIAQEMADTETTQGVFAVVKLDQKLDVEPDKVLLLDNIQDPGNLGTMIRSADAAGFDFIGLGKGTVDAYNQKVLRSGQGSHFHIQLDSVDLNTLIPDLQSHGLKVYGTALSQDTQPYKEIIRKDKLAILVGNEGSGVDEALLNLTDANLYIPIKGQAESLNVAIAASILMFHFS